MRKSKLSSILAVFLSVVMLMGTIPAVVFAAGNSTSTKANYDAYRGSGMSADANGVMVYDDLASYYKRSRSNVALSTAYSVQGVNASGGNVAVTETYDECPYVYADYAIYVDESIQGTTVEIRYGLSMMDSVYYIDSATGEIVAGDKSPIELTANNKNNNYPDYNAGYGMVYDEEGNLEYTTRYYEEKSILFYIINHSCSERIGQEDDVSILSDYIRQGFMVVTLDFKCHKDAVTPYIEQALVSARAMFDSYTADDALVGLGVNTSSVQLYFLPEGCRVERDVWFWDPSVFGVEGTMERFRQ